MKLLHHPEVELSRQLLANKPETVEVLVCGETTYGYAVSAYPSVVFEVPERLVKVLQFDAQRNLIGAVEQWQPAHEVVIRSPLSWDAVDTYINWYLENTSV